MPRFSGPDLLAADHDLSRFDCGTESLNHWLEKYARSAAGAGAARTYVVTDAEQGRVVGYHALTAGSVEHDAAPPRVRKGMPRHPIPVVVLARLAVDRSVQGHGLGAWLLRDAMLRTLRAAEQLGIRAMLVHALDDSARRFYLRHGLEPSPTDAHNLQMLTKDIRAALTPPVGL